PLAMLRSAPGGIIVALAAPEVSSVLRRSISRRVAARTAPAASWLAACNGAQQWGGRLVLISSLILGSLHAMVPITMTATGEILSERAGLVNIGLEGILLISAFTAVVGAEAYGPLAGLLVGLLTGAFIGLIHGIIAIYFRGDQTISGVGINVLGAGLVAFGLVWQWGQAGFHQVPRAVRVPAISTPWGPLSPMVIVALVLAVLTWYLMNRTNLGLKLRAVGENPAAADAAGVSVEKVRLFGAVFAGALAGLAGAFLHRLAGHHHEELVGGARVHRAGHRGLQRPEPAAGHRGRAHLRLFQQPGAGRVYQPGADPGHSVSVPADAAVRGDAAGGGGRHRPGPLPQGQRPAVSPRVAAGPAGGQGTYTVRMKTARFRRTGLSCFCLVARASLAAPGGGFIRRSARPASAVQRPRAEPRLRAARPR